MSTDQQSRGSQPDPESPKVTVRLKVGRTANDAARGKKHLTPNEVDQICKCIQRSSRYAVRDELMILCAFHHGFRAGELVKLQWQNIDLKTRQMRVERLKNGIDTMHPITSKREIMLLNRLHKAQNKPNGGYVFNTERNTPVSRNGFQKVVNKFSELALGVKWNAHSLRHGCGTELVERGIHLSTIQHYMGHRNIQNTAVYLHGAASRFKKIRW